MLGLGVAAFAFGLSCEATVGDEGVEARDTDLGADPSAPDVCWELHGWYGFTGPVEVPSATVEGEVDAYEWVLQDATEVTAWADYCWTLRVFAEVTARTGENVRVTLGTREAPLHVLADWAAAKWDGREARLEEAPSGGRPGRCHRRGGADGQERSRRHRSRSVISLTHGESHVPIHSCTIAARGLRVRPQSRWRHYMPR